MVVRINDILAQVSSSSVFVQDVGTHCGWVTLPHGCVSSQRSTLDIRGRGLSSQRSILNISGGRLYVSGSWSALDISGRWLSVSLIGLGYSLCWKSNWRIRLYCSILRFNHIRVSIDDCCLSVINISDRLRLNYVVLDRRLAVDESGGCGRERVYSDVS